MRRGPYPGRRDRAEPLAGPTRDGRPVLRALEEVEMRRVIVTLCSLALLVAVFAPVAAAGPQHGRGGFSFDYSFDAGVCPFPVRWVEDGSRMRALTFPVQPDGDQLVRYAGPQWSTITNLTTDAPMVVGGGLRLDMLLHPDGTTDVRIAGTVVAYLPGRTRTLVLAAPRPRPRQAGRRLRDHVALVQRPGGRPLRGTGRLS